MKKIKLVLFDPQTLKKRTYRFTFQWNYYNHCWNVHIETPYSSNDKICNCNPSDYVERIKDNIIRTFEYATIKVA